MTKATIKDYQVLLDCKNKEIELLKHKLDNIDRLYNVRCCECERKAVQELSSLHIKNMELKQKLKTVLDNSWGLSNDRT